MSLNIWWFNGKYTPSNNVKIPITDLSVNRGFGIFEFLRTYNRKPFYLKEHLQRLHKSASLLGLKVPISDTQINKVINTLIFKNKEGDLNIKLLLTGGESKDGILPTGKHNFAIMATYIANYPRQFYTDGVKVITIPFSRLYPDVKSINYLGAVKGVIKANKEKAIDALYVSVKGEILEATRSNFFAFFGNKLYTPKAEILKGITREIVIKLAGKHFDLHIDTIRLNQLNKATECFITATTKEIMPVVKINNQIIGNGKVGKNTKKLMELFRAFVKSV
ncbi:MAG: aminotransferase class IV [Actinobacteria bacterium]|nr:aminotransferase class IV [Actinomycetota bacterium]